MALSPGIPTSFVPKQPVQTRTVRPGSSGRNLFLIGALGVAAVSIVAAGATYVYAHLLQRTLAAKQAELETAQQNVDKNTIEEFVRLRDRLDSGETLLDNHIMLSQVFDTIEMHTLQNVRFQTMKLVVAGDRTAKLEMQGTAKTFNALAAQSNEFASEKNIKRAIFSGIGVDDTKLVKFKLTADIDRDLIVGTTATSPTAPVQPIVPTGTLNDTPPPSVVTPPTTQVVTPPPASTTSAARTTAPVGATPPTP